MKAKCVLDTIVMPSVTHCAGVSSVAEYTVNDDASTDFVCGAPNMSYIRINVM